MRRDQLNRRIHQTSAAAKTERLSSPQILQRGRAVRAGANPNEVAVIASTSITIPAKSFVEIVSYDEGNGRFIVKKPSAHNLPAKIVLVTGDEIPANAQGRAYADGLMTVDRGGSVIEGFNVGTTKDDWESRYFHDGPYYCYGNTASDAYIRPAGSYGRFEMRFGLFKIKNVALPYGRYSCRKQIIDETYYGSATSIFIDDPNPPFDSNVTVYHIGETASAVHVLEVGDFLVAWREQGDEGNHGYWVGFSPDYSWWKA